MPQVVAVKRRACVGAEHCVREFLYEAAVLGLKALKRSEWIEVIGPGTRIVIAVQEPPVEHFLMFAQLTRWLEGGATHPADLLKKKRLKYLLAS